MSLVTALRYGGTLMILGIHGDPESGNDQVPSHCWNQPEYFQI